MMLPQLLPVASMGQAQRAGATSRLLQRPRDCCWASEAAAQSASFPPLRSAFSLLAHVYVCTYLEALIPVS